MLLSNTKKKKLTKDNAIDWK